MYAGYAAEALGRFATAMRLDPHYPGIVLHYVAQANFSPRGGGPRLCWRFQSVGRQEHGTGRREKGSRAKFESSEPTTESALNDGFIFREPSTAAIHIAL
jgi:hypothetical protein